MINPEFILTFLKSPEVISFISSYFTSTGLDLLFESARNKYSSKSMEYQFVDALNVALHDTCSYFGMETDYDAISETFVVSLKDVVHDIDAEGLSAILTNATGIESQSSDEDVFEYWISRFDMAISHPDRTWLYNYIQQRYRRNTMRNSQSNEKSIEYLWEQYSEQIYGLIKKVVPYDKFLLEEIYVQLFGYFRLYEGGNYDLTSMFHIVKSEEWLEKWVTDKNDKNILLVSGKPASGKTTLLKKIASNLILNGIYAVFIPLKNFSFNQDIHQSVMKYCETEIGFNIFEYYSNEEIVLLFDGLDEISLRGADSLKKAIDFVEYLKKAYDDKSIKIIVSGRSLSISSVSKLFVSGAREYVLHLFPLYYDADYIDTYWPGASADDIEDLRPAWWERYGNIRDKDFSGLQYDIMNSVRCLDETFDEITGEPFLLYLLASSYEDKLFNFEEGLSVNILYKYFVNKVYRNEWRNYSNSQYMISEESFYEFMKEVALCSWHSGNRIISIKSIKDRLNNDRFIPILNRLTSDGTLNEGITSLLLMFYVDRNNAHDREQSFEFTQKSFSDYFIGIKVAEVVIEIFGDGYYKEDYLKLIDALGNGCLDIYVDDFMRNRFQEIYTDTSHKVESACSTLTTLFSKFISHDSRVCNIVERDGSTYVDNRTKILNKNLFRILCALAKTQKRNVVIPFINSCQFRDWINYNYDWHGPNVDDPRDYATNVMKLISRVDFYAENGLYFPGIQLPNYEIGYCNFKGCSMPGANFYFARIYNVEFVDVDLSDTIFKYAVMNEIVYTINETQSFQNSDLSNSNIKKSRFENANFKYAVFNKAKINSTEFVNCSFVNCIFFETELTDVKFYNCKFDSLLNKSTLTKVTFIDCCQGVSILNTRLSECIYRCEGGSIEISISDGLLAPNVVYDIYEIQNAN